MHYIKWKKSGLKDYTPFNEPKLYTDNRLVVAEGLW